MLRALADASGAAPLHALTGAALIGERAALNGFTIPGRISAGGGCRLLPCKDSHWVALNLSRPDDRDLLPALFEDGALDGGDDAAIAARMTGCAGAAILRRGREMGLAIALLDEDVLDRGMLDVGGAPVHYVTYGTKRRESPPKQAPLVIDLSALWAGPLASHLLSLAGAQVVKVESRNRPDSMRGGDPALFARLNQNKASVALDLRDLADRAALLALIARADMVIEAARPRALAQLGIDAGALVAATPGLVWTSITGHGVAGNHADHIGFGDDCGVAGGLSAALYAATGTVGFVGDAIADPLTGITAARLAFDRWQSGLGGRLFLSMSGTVRTALAETRTRDAGALDRSLRSWAAGAGHLFPSVPARSATPPAPLGADTATWLAPC